LLIHHRLSFALAVQPDSFPSGDRAGLQTGEA
jgi:hypothetical protein